MTGVQTCALPIFEKNDKKCSEKSKLLKEILLINPIETIVIGLCFNCYFSKNDNPFTYHESDQKRLLLSNDVGLNAAKISFYNLVKKMSLKHKIIILHDNPVDDRFDPTYIVGSLSKGKSSFPII